MCEIYREKRHTTYRLLGIKFNFLKDFLGYEIIGNGNKIFVEENGFLRELENTEKIRNLNIQITGNDNKIILRAKSFYNCSILLNCSNSNIEIGNNCRLNDFHVSADCGNNQCLKIDENTTSFYTAVYLNEENATLKIGKDCMLSGNISIWPTDGHAIFDKTTKDIINKPNETIIGNHCWIGYGTHICKNTKLSNDIVVGARSVVTKEFKESNVIIAGNPAKIIKQNIDWNRDNASNLIKKQKQ